MSLLDWIVLIVTLVGIILYGLYKSRSEKNLESYFLIEPQTRPGTLILLSIIGDTSQCCYFSFRSWPGIYRWNAVYSKLFWFAIGDGRFMYHVCPCISPVEIIHCLRVPREKV